MATRLSFNPFPVGGARNREFTEAEILEAFGNTTRPQAPIARSVPAPPPTTPIQTRRRRLAPEPETYHPIPARDIYGRAPETDHPFQAPARGGVNPAVKSKVYKLKAERAAREEARLDRLADEEVAHYQSNPSTLSYLATNPRAVRPSAPFTGGAGEDDDIDFEGMDWGSFTKQMKRFQQKNKNSGIKDLDQFANMILDTPDKYAKKTLNRARFYKNVILKGGADRDKTPYLNRSPDSPIRSTRLFETEAEKDAREAAEIVEEMAAIAQEDAEGAAYLAAIAQQDAEEAALFATIPSPTTTPTPTPTAPPPNQAEVRREAIARRKQGGAILRSGTKTGDDLIQPHHHGTTTPNTQSVARPPALTFNQPATVELGSALQPATAIDHALQAQPVAHYDYSGGSQLPMEDNFFFPPRDRDMRYANINHGRVIPHHKFFGMS